MNNRISCALYQAGAKKGFWAEAGTYMTIIENCLIEEGEDKELCKKLMVSSKALEKIRIWGCAAIRHIPVELRKKFDEKGDACVFLGLDQGGYRLYRMKDNRIIVSNDVVFDEDSFPLKKNFIESSDPVFKELVSLSSTRVEVDNIGI